MHKQTKTIKAVINKSAVDGTIVSKQYAKTHPNTTYALKIEKPVRKKEK